MKRQEQYWRLTSNGEALSINQSIRHDLPFQLSKRTIILSIYLGIYQLENFGFGAYL